MGHRYLIFMVSHMDIIIILPGLDMVSSTRVLYILIVPLPGISLCNHL